MTQAPLFDAYNPELAADAVVPVPSSRPSGAVIGEARKCIGMTRALDAVSAWRTRAEAWVLALTPGCEFTADHLIHHVGLPRDSRPNTNNGVGAVLSGLARRGVIADTGRTIRSARELRHAGKVSVWRRRAV